VPSSPVPTLRDPERLAALRNAALLDTPVEAAFDRLIALAATQLGTPIALVTLVDENRQFFKSSLGLPEPWSSRRESSLSYSFCRHVVESGEPLVVTDARLHPVFKDHPAIEAMGVVAYLGVPLIAAGDFVLGSLCVIDTQPRQWTGEQKAVLAEFASVVMDEIAYREAIRARERAEERLRRQQVEIEEGIRSKSASLAQVAHEVRISEERFQLVALATNDCVWDWDLVSSSLWWNDGLRNLFGYSREEAGDDIAFWYEHIHPEDRERVVRGIHAVIDARQQVWTDEYRFLKADHSVAEVYDRGYVLFDASGAAVRMVGAMMDVTERNRAQQALRRSEARYRALVEGAVHGIYFTAADGTLLDCNAAFVTILGYGRREEIIGRNTSDLFWKDPSRRDEIVARYPAGLHGLEAQWLRADGTTITVRLTGQPVQLEEEETGYETLVEDVTERRAFEEKLRQTQKMEGLGRLAGGIAHDFNNVLMIIAGYGELLSRDLAADDPQRRKVDAILTAAGRATGLTRQLLSFSRQQTGEAQLMPLNQLVQEASRHLPRLIGEDIEVVLDLAPDAGQLRIDPAQFEQVILNLATNARDAMPGGGRLELTTGSVDLEPAAAARHPGVTAGRYVRVSVADNGTGMDEATRAHVFEPFFSTKAVGKGTGLGLYMVYGLVTQNGGWVNLHSEPGSGSRFDLHFPRIAGVAGRPKAAAAPADALRRTETVLLVEDEPGLRTLLRDYLRQAGYQVLEAENGAEALRRSREWPAIIHVLVTDIIMPHMNGEQVAERLRAERPRLKVIFMSGYAPEDARLRLDRAAALTLQKPFPMETLAVTLRELLDGKSG